MKPSTIAEALQSRAALDDRVFCNFVIRGADKAIRYSDLLREGSRFARFFLNNQVRPGETVLIVLPHSPDLLYSFLGAILMGAIPSFLPSRTDKQDRELFWSSHRKLFERIGRGSLLTRGENIPHLEQHTSGIPLRLLRIEAVENGESEFVPATISPDQIAFLQHSSGTTGLKKGVALSHRSVLTQIESYAEALNMGDGDRIISWLPLYHDMGLIACFLLPLVTGIPVTLLDPFEWVTNPKLVFDAVKTYRGTLCWQPNFAFHHLCRTVRASATLDLSSMRAWIDCSEPCRTETFELFERTFSSVGVKAEQLQVCYAMAETVFAVSQTPLGKAPHCLTVCAETLQQEARIRLVPPSGKQQKILSTGAPIPGVQVRIVDDIGTQIPPDQVGEVTVSGSCLFSGYFKLEAETARKLRGGWYYTGDLGFLHEDQLYITGRKNDLIIVHGRNYYAHDLEYLVNQVSGVHPGRSVAVGWYRPEVGSEDVVIIAEAKDREDSQRTRLASEIKQAILNETGLLVYDVHVVNDGWLIKTTSGKISRVENLNKYRAALSSEQVA
jgi:fatty-acyl-CoA synthase